MKRIVAVFLLTLAFFLFPIEKIHTQVNTDYHVKVIVFYPKGHTPQARKLDIANALVEEVRKYYLKTLNKTFYAEPAEAVIGDKNADVYDMGKIPMVVNELAGKGKYPPKTKLIVIMDPHETKRNAYGGSVGWFEGQKDYKLGATENGVGFIVVDSIFTNTTDRKTVGVISHELGHGFSLPHPQGCDTGDPKPGHCNKTPMYAWYNFSMNNEGYTWLDTSWAPEKQTLLSSPWMWNTKLTPRDPLPPKSEPSYACLGLGKIDCKL